MASFIIVVSVFIFGKGNNEIIKSLIVYCRLYLCEWTTGMYISVLYLAFVTPFHTQDVLPRKKNMYSNTRVPGCYTRTGPTPCDGVRAQYPTFVLDHGLLRHREQGNRVPAGFRVPA